MPDLKPLQMDSDSEESWETEVEPAPKAHREGKRQSAKKAINMKPDADHGKPQQASKQKSKRPHAETADDISAQEMMRPSKRQELDVAQLQSAQTASEAEEESEGHYTLHVRGGQAMLTPGPALPREMLEEMVQDAVDMMGRDLQQDMISEAEVACEQSLSKMVEDEVRDVMKSEMKEMMTDMLEETKETALKEMRTEMSKKWNETLQKMML